MTEERVKRKLSAILSADVAGYDWLLNGVCQGLIRDVVRHTSRPENPKKFSESLLTFYTKIC